MDSVGVPEVPIAHQGEPHCATALLVDTSGSMHGPPIDSLTEGLRTYKQLVLDDDEARDIVETAVIGFGSRAEVLAPFGPIDDFPDMTLEADGTTAMAAAIDLALEQLELRKEEYRHAGTDYFRPFLILMTDGAPTDMPNIDEYAQKIDEGAAAKKFVPIFVAVEGADTDTLKKLAGKHGVVFGIKELKFEQFFKWLSKTQHAVSQSTPGERVELPNPTEADEDDPDGFAFML